MTGAHHCPGCGVALPGMARYPWHFCTACCGRVTDAAGARLEFANTTAFGGFSWRRAGDADWTEAQGYVGLLDGRPVQVREARFGGIVAEPLVAPAPPVGPIRRGGGAR